jgi:hypothetical protein
VFSIDPVEVLRATDKEWAIRVAAAHVIDNDIKRAKEER